MCDPREQVEHAFAVHGDSAAAAAVGLAALAAVFPQVVGEGAQGGVVGAIVDEPALGALLEHAGRRQPFEVVTQRGPRDLELGLEVADHGALGVALHHQAHDREPHRTAQGSQLPGVALELRVHRRFHDSRNVGGVKRAWSAEV